jgi:hypothetical protein
MQSHHDHIAAAASAPVDISQAEWRRPGWPPQEEYKSGGFFYDFQARRIEALKSEVHRRQNGGKMPGPTYFWRVNEVGRQGVHKA